ncbi:MAG: 16S rRNA (adenine(1518)-N(6)/adenine(1519)-N(6))-dimethyltransferase RsmA [Brevinematales bacterium]
MNEIYDPFSINFLKKTFQEKNIFLSKNRGQNFLIDRNIANKIIENVPLNMSIFEVGCGAGALSKLVLERNQKLYGVEIDRKVYQLLKENLNDQNFILFHEDFLKFDLNLIEEKELFFLSNLPYSISGEAIRKFIEEDKLKSGVLMLQKEFVDRMLAKPDTKNYGLTSIISHFYLEINKLFPVSKNCFFPVPEVDSLVISINKKRCDFSQTSFSEFIKKAFSQRRKTIFNNLKQLNFSESELEKLSINPFSRPESLDFEKWAILFEYYQSHKIQE